MNEPNTKPLRYQKIVSELKKDSDYYPSVLIREYDSNHNIYKGALFMSTLVRIERDGKHYIVHCVVSMLNTSNAAMSNLFLRLINSVHRITYLYEITGEFEDVDELQESEKDRLLRTLLNREES